MDIYTNPYPLATFHGEVTTNTVVEVGEDCISNGHHQDLRPRIHVSVISGSGVLAEGPPPCYLEASVDALPTYAEAIGIPSQLEYSGGWRDSVSSTAPLTSGFSSPSFCSYFGNRQCGAAIMAGGCALFFVILLFGGAFRDPSNPYTRLLSSSPEHSESYTYFDWDKLTTTSTTTTPSLDLNPSDEETFWDDDGVHNESLKYSVFK